MFDISVVLWSVGAFVVVGVVGCLSAMAGQLYERRKWERQLLERSGLLGNPPEPQPTHRMEHLEVAVDAMAVELERIGEGQRFVTKLLAERPRDTNVLRSPQPGSVPASPRTTA